MNWDEFKIKTGHVLSYIKDKINLELLEDRIEYIAMDKKVVYTKEEFLEFMKEVGKYKLEKYLVTKDNYYEIPVAISNKRSRGASTSSMCKKISYQNGAVDIEIISITNIMLFNILKNIDLQKYGKIHVFSSLTLRAASIGLFELLEKTFNIRFSLIIRYRNYLDKTKIKDWSKSHLFNICVMSNTGFKILDSDEAILDMRPNFYISLKTYERPLPKKLLYKIPAVEKYQMAAASDDPLVQFLGYYNVPEYFSGEVQLLKQVELIKKKVKEKKLSINDDKDIAAIINTINNNTVEIRRNEKDYLELTFNNYTSIERIVNRLKFTEPNMISYYKKYCVKFSGGAKVDFSDDKEIVIKNLASRIYSTRNSIVHNKSYELEKTEKKSYNHFRDHQELSNEIPLVKVIAEELIINTAEEI